MSVARPDDRIPNQDPARGVGPQGSSDPIARNPKDIGKGKAEIHAGETGPRYDADREKASLAKVFDTTQGNPNDRVPAIAARVAPLPDRPWAVNQHAPAGQSPMELVASILRFKWTLVLVSILTSVPLIAAIWTQIVPQYKARAELHVRPYIPVIVTPTDENGRVPFYDQFVNTQVSEIRGMTVLQNALDQQQVKNTRWCKNPPRSLKEKLRGSKPPLLERLRDSVSARPRPRTEIIDISFTDPSAKDATVILQAVVDEYIKHIRLKSDATSDGVYKELQNQYQSLEQDIKGREKTCAGLRRLLRTDLPQELVSNKRVRLDAQEARLSELQLQIQVLQWEMEQTDANDSNDTGRAFVGDLQKQPPYYEDPEWLRLDRDEQTISHQISSSLYRPNHPTRLKLEKDLEFAKELRQRREARLDGEWGRRMTGSIATPGLGAAMSDSAGAQQGLPLAYQLARAQRENQLLQAEFDTNLADFNKLFDMAQTLQDESDNLRHKREQFARVRDRMVAKDMERNAPGLVSVMMPAYTPSEPASDRRLVFTAMALFAGVGLGGGAAFLRASRNQSIYAPKDMPQPMQVPFLGYVPLVRTKNAPGKALWGEITQNQVLLVESIRLVRTALLSRLNGKATVTMLITSAAAGTGKSSLTKILGKSMALAGKSVLMIDADFHKTTLSNWFNLSDSPGFMDSLRDKSVPEQNIAPTEVPGLSIMPVGRRGEKSLVFEEISNGAFKACMGQLSEKYKYDVILLDSAPLLPVADSTILAGQVDGTIMVERESLSQRTNVTDALARLGSTGGRLLGTVFVGSAGRNNYGYAYNYYHKNGKA